MICVKMKLKKKLKNVIMIANGKQNKIVINLYPLVSMFFILIHKVPKFYETC